MSEAQEYVARLVGYLTKYGNDPAKCAAIMAHDRRYDGCGVVDFLAAVEDDEYDEAHPDEAEARWAGAGDIGETLDRLDREQKG